VFINDIANSACKLNSNSPTTWPFLHATLHHVMLDSLRPSVYSVCQARQQVVTSALLFSGRLFEITSWSWEHCSLSWQCSFFGHGLSKMVLLTSLLIYRSII